jgi:hypothetical protein
MSACVTDAMRAATIVVVPCRPGIFDLDAVRETVSFARQSRRPYAVVINGAPPRRQDVESPMVTQAPRNTTPSRRRPPKSPVCGRRSKDR